MTDPMTPTDPALRRDYPRSTWTRLGMIVPSSNTVLEPYTAAMLRPLGDSVTAHFARLKVTEISLSGASKDQFGDAAQLAAAAQLAEAFCDVIAWNGTSGSWLGLAGEEAMVARMEAATGARATTTSLAFREAYGVFGAKRIGLVTPYLAEVQEKITANYAASGLTVVSEEHLEDPGNFTFAEYSDTLVADLVRRAAESKPDAIAIVCTNFRGTRHVAALEAELGIPVLDSIAVTLWQCLRLAGIDTTPLGAEGRLFEAG